MEAFTYKGITDGKYVEGDIEALNIDEASHLLKEKKIIITNIVKSKKKKADRKAKRAADAYAKGNDKKGDRLTEGSLVRQSLRRRFGSNRPK